MKNFIVTYASGLVSEIKAELDSVEAFCNQHFGSTWGDAQAAGAKVEMQEAPTAPTESVASSVDKEESPSDLENPVPVAAAAGAVTATVTHP